MNTMSGDPRTIAIVVPVLNEGRDLARFLSDLLHAQGMNELVVVDGGSADRSAGIAEQCIAAGGLRGEVVRSAPGRSRQMNAGAARCRSDILLFLHADTRLPAGACERVRAAIGDGHSWGYFTVRLDGGRRLYRVIEKAMNLRSRLSRIATGDQALFVRREVFANLGGFAGIPLMEDIELCRRLKRIGPPAVISQPVTTSTRRWVDRGIGRTILLMWLLRAFYWLGVKPDRLAVWYRHIR